MRSDHYKIFVLVLYYLMSLSFKFHKFHKELSLKKNVQNNDNACLILDFANFQNLNIEALPEFEKYDKP